MVDTRLPTPKEISESFKLALQKAIDVGEYPSTSQGFDTQVFNALIVVAEQYPHVKAEAITIAKAELAGQLDGSHAKEQRAMWTKLAATRGYK